MKIAPFAMIASYEFFFPIHGRHKEWRLYGNFIGIEYRDSGALLKIKLMIFTFGDKQTEFHRRYTTTKL